MKVKITFELDLKDTHYNIPKVKLIPVCLMNLGQWFYELHLYQLEKRIGQLTDKIGCSEEVIKALLKDQEQDIKLSKQLFNNYKVEGITDDGHKFEFTHQDPGYKEKTLVDGIEVQLEPYDE